MSRICFLLILIALLNSCATLVNTKYTAVNIEAEDDSVKYCLDYEKTQWHETPDQIYVKRSRNDLMIIAKKDSTEKLIQVNSKLSNAFWFGNIFAGGYIGYAIDLTNPRKYTYPKHIIIGVDPVSHELTGKYKKLLSPEKYLLSFRVSVPEGNFFYLNKGHGYGNTFGFLGISGGMEYYISNKRSLSIDSFYKPGELSPRPGCYYGSMQCRRKFFW